MAKPRSGSGGKAPRSLRQICMYASKIRVYEYQIGLSKILHNLSFLVKKKARQRWGNAPMPPFEAYLSGQLAFVSALTS